MGECPVTRNRRPLHFFASTLFGMFLAAASAPQALADDPAFLSFGAGYYDINDDMDAGEFRIEYRSGAKYWIFKPFVGAMATTDAAFYGYGGVLVDVYFGNRFVLTPNFAAGLYAEGDGKNLGHVVEFRSGLEASYRFDNRARLGLLFYHISNASLDDNNPGTEVLTLTYSLPLN